MLTLPRNPARGVALFIALVLASIALAAMLSLVQLSATNNSGANGYLDGQAALTAAQGGANLVTSDILSEYNITSQSGSPNFRTFIVNLYGLNNNSSVYPQKWNGTRLGNAVITNVKLTRSDARDNPSLNIFHSDLFVDVEATTDTGVKAWVSRAVSFGNPSNYSGFDYGVLTRDITCTFCHLKVQNIDKVTNSNSSLYGSYERVKVGTLNYMAMRATSADASIEGTLYQRGTFADEFTGTPQTPSQLTGSTIKSTSFNANATTEQQLPANGATVETSFVNAATDPSTGLLLPRQNCYLNYPSTETQETDGDMPTQFPAPFPDANNNHLIDPNELSAAEIDATGHIGGGISYSFPKGSAYSNATLPTSGPVANINGTTTGHTFLIGTQSNPIQVDGKVVIDGDVVIKGYVQGTGQIWATGNVYMPSDVRYNNQIDDNGNEVFGVAPDGSPNLVGYIAGKNIVVGDYLSQVNHWDSSKTQFLDYGKPEPGVAQPGYQLPYTDTDGATDYGTTTVNGQTYGKINFANFVMEELGIFNRTEITKTLSAVPTGTPHSKYYDSSSPYITNANNYNGINPQYQPGYIPRYYTMYPNSSVGLSTPFSQSPPPVYLNDKNQFIASQNNWNNTADPHTYSTMRQLSQIPKQDPTSVSKEVVLNIHPDWITPGNMLNLLLNEEAQRPSEPRRVDGLLYTNNAIFAIERQETQTYSGTWNPSTQKWTGGAWSKVPTKSGGHMVVNGSIIAPDLGVLVTGGTVSTSTPPSSPFPYYTPINRGGATTYEKKAFTLNYDKRVRNLLNIQNTTQTVWGFTSIGITKHGGPLP